jgi:hypothetical protein
MAIDQPNIDSSASYFVADPCQCMLHCYTLFNNLPTDYICTTYYNSPPEHHAGLNRDKTIVQNLVLHEWLAAPECSVIVPPTGAQLSFVGWEACCPDLQCMTDMPCVTFCAYSRFRGASPYRRSQNRRSRSTAAFFWQHKVAKHSCSCIWETADRATPPPLFSSCTGRRYIEALLYCHMSDGLRAASAVL